MDGPAAREFLEAVRDAEQFPELLVEINRFRARTKHLHLFTGAPPADPIPDRLAEGEGNPDGSMGELPDARYAGFPRDPPLRHEPGAPLNFPVIVRLFSCRKGGRESVPDL
jgi:hypothetical protein